ncbi:MAG: hypothetical protein AAFQ54_07165 [Pseudomonadota bacterium]
MTIPKTTPPKRSTSLFRIAKKDEGGTLEFEAKGWIAIFAMTILLLAALGAITFAGVTFIF